MKSSQTMPLQDRMDHVFRLVTSSDFKAKRGLGNEVPFFICPYSAEEAVEFKAAYQALLRRVETTGTSILELDLYDITIEMCKERGIWDKILEMEVSLSKDKLLETLRAVLDPENRLVPEISKRMEAVGFDLMFLTGVGEVYPFIRSHTILNNLQSAAKDKPTVLFFPGEYRQADDVGTSLDLFGKLRDDKYYRAFNIFNCDVG